MENKWIEVSQKGYRRKFPVSAITEIVLWERGSDTDKPWIEVIVSTRTGSHSLYYIWRFEDTDADADKANGLFDALHGGFKGDVYVVGPLVGEFTME